MTLSRRLEALRQSVMEACGRVDRDPASVRIVAVTKYASLEAVQQLVDLGHRDLGESRPQQLVERATHFDDSSIAWHLIGPLQRNKARKVLPFAAVIHSADNLRLLEALNRLAAELNLRPRVLIEANISQESSKQGFSTGQLRSAWLEIHQFQRLEIAGLMTMAPYSDSPEASRPVFRSLRLLRDELAASTSRRLPELSMGMSNDYRVAIEEGATIIRIGSALFES